VQITGSILTYDLADPLGGKGEPVKAAGGAISRPEAFQSAKAMSATAFHALSACPMWSRSSASTRRPTGRGGWRAARAYPVAERFLKALRIAGGQPSRRRREISSDIAERPACGFARFHLSPERRHHRQPSGARKTRRPRRSDRPIRKIRFSAGESARLRAFAILRQARQIRSVGRLSLARQFLFCEFPQLRSRTMRRRFRSPGSGYPPRRPARPTTTAVRTCDPKQTGRRLPSATAS